MEQSKAMEYESRKTLSDVLNPRYIYINKCYLSENTSHLFYEVRVVIALSESNYHLFCEVI
jgi:hypothetical protein